MLVGNKWVRALGLVIFMPALTLFCRTTSLPFWKIYVRFCLSFLSKMAKQKRSWFWSLKRVICSSSVKIWLKLVYIIKKEYNILLTLVKYEISFLCRPKVGNKTHLSDETCYRETSGESKLSISPLYLTALVKSKS